MPEIVTPQPTGLQKYTGTPEQMVDAQQMYLYGLQGLPLGAASHLAGPGIQNTETGRPDWGNWKNYIPGALTYLYGGATGLAEMTTNALLRNPPVVDPETGVRIVDEPTEQAMRAEAPQIKVPGHEEAVRLNEESVRTALRNIPHFEPTTEAGKVGQDIGIGMGQGTAGVVPMGVLPKALSVPLGIVANPPSAAGVGAIAGGVSGALASPAGEDFTPTVLSPDGSEVITPSPVTSTPMSEAAPATPSSGFSLIKSAAAATLPKGGAPLPPIPDDFVPQVIPPPAAPSLRPTLTPSATSLSPENDTGIPYWKITAGVGVAAATGWLIAKHAPGGINAAADILRGRPRTFAAGNEILESKIPQGSYDKPLEMPLPGNASGLTHRFTANMQDSNAVMNQYSRSPMVNPTPAEQRAAVAANDMINNPGNANRRFERLYRTGVDEGSNYAFPKMVDYRQAAENLTYGQQQIADFAIWYKSEQNLRNVKIGEARDKGVMWTRETDHLYRVSFPDMSTDDLAHTIRLGESDPAVAAVIERNKAMQTAVVDYEEKLGLIDKQQAERARTVYPDFMPTIGEDGTYYHSWDDKMRTIGSGYSKPPAPAWDAMDKHFGNSIQSAQQRAWQRDVVMKQWRLQEADPNFPKVVTHVPEQTKNVTPLTTPTAETSMRRSITVHVDGKPMTFDVHNSAWLRGLKGGPKQMAMSNAIATGIRAGFTNATTGPAALLFSNPFFMKTVLRDMPTMQAQAHPDLWRGNIERAARRRIPGLPFDPSAIPGTAVTAAKDATTVIVKHLADALASRNSELSMTLRPILGHKKVDALVDWMRAREAHSKLSSRSGHGVGSGGNRVSLNITPSVSEKGGSFRDPTHETVAPLLNKPNFGRIPKSIPLPNFIRAGIQNQVRGTVQSAIRLRALVNDLYEVLASSPHNYMNDVNIGNPKFTSRTLANEIQNITGNPSTRGSGKFAHWASSNVPFYNTSVQGTAAWKRSFTDRPFRTAITTTGTTTAITLIGYALLEHLTALLSGKEHVDHLENKLSNSTQAHNATFFHGPGTHPTDHTEFPISTEAQWLWPYISGLVGHAVGTWTAHDNEDTLSRITHTLAGMFEGHLSVDTVKQWGSAAVSSFVPADVTAALATAIAAVTGKQVKNIPEQIVDNTIKGDPTFSNLTSGGGPQHKVPGQEGSDTTLLGAEAGTLHAVMSALGTALGNAWDFGHNYTGREKTAGFEWAYEGLKNDYRQSWQDNTRWMNSVWRNNLAQSTYGPLEERTQQMWHNVAATGNVNSDIKADGFSGMRQGVPLLKTGESPIPPMSDPKMRDMYMTVASYAKGINREIMPRENQIRAQIANMKDAPYMPDERRRIGNELSEKLYQVMSEKHRMLLDLNALLSARLGGRHVDVGQHIDWQGTVEQFHY